MKDPAAQEASHILDGGPADFTRLIADNAARWRRAIREMGLTLE